MEEQIVVKSSITGYGLVFKSVMTSQEISIEAKGIHAYLSSFAGSSNIAFPSINKITHDLQISENRFHNRKKELVKAGFLTIHRERTEKGFSKNIYTIYHEPVTRQNEVLPNKNETVTRQNVGIGNEGIGNVGIGNVGIGNEGTISNSITSNSFINNSNKNNSSKSNSESNDHDNNNPFKEVLNSYQQNIQPTPPPLILQKISDDFEYFGKDIMLFAIEKTTLKNEREYRFINYLLSVWRKQGLKTIEAVKQYEEIGAGKAKKTVASKEITPKWITEETNTTTNTKEDEAELERERKKLQEELNGLWEDEAHA